jgi:uncharacterized protein (DUF1697 family)
MTRHVALLYSVVLGPERRVKSLELLRLAEAAGFGAARTSLSSGNLIFEARGKPAELELTLEKAVADHLGRLIPVFVRSEAEWRGILAGNPFPAETLADPSCVAVRILRASPDAGVVARISARREEGERLKVIGRSLWLAAPPGLSQSPMFRAAGSDWAGEGTFRNASAIARIAAALD